MIPLRSNPGHLRVQGSPRVVNAYVEVSGDDQKAPNMLIACDGLQNFSTPTDTPCRGMFFVRELGALYTVHLNSLYKVTSDGVSVRIGAVPGSEPAFFARNDADPIQIVVVSNDTAWKVENDVVTILNYPFSPIGVEDVDGYFIFPVADGRFFISGINTTDVDPLDFATAEANPDGLIAVAENRREIYMIGQDSTEVWVNTGAAAFPFERLTGAYIEKGSRSPHTIAKVDGLLVWVGFDGVVYRVAGYNFEAISQPFVEDLIRESTLETLLGFSYVVRGHHFYALQGQKTTGTKWTVEWDSETGFWHHRESYLDRPWRAFPSARAWDKTYVGDQLSGQIFEVKDGLKNEDGDPLLWGWDTTLIHDFPKHISFDELTLDFEVGDGIGSTKEGEVMLGWSDNAGRTWPIERTASLGAQGNFNTHVKFTRMGRGARTGRMLRVRISDEVMRGCSLINIEGSAG